MLREKGTKNTGLKLILYFANGFGRSEPMDETAHTLDHISTGNVLFPAGEGWGKPYGVGFDQYVPGSCQPMHCSAVIPLPPGLIFHNGQSVM